jgi:hypothetical protein
VKNEVCALGKTIRITVTNYFHCKAQAEAEEIVAYEAYEQQHNQIAALQ